MLDECKKKRKEKYGPESVWEYRFGSLQHDERTDELSEGKATKRKESKTSSNPAPTQMYTFCPDFLLSI